MLTLSISAYVTRAEVRYGQLLRCNKAHSSRLLAVSDNAGLPSGICGISPHDGGWASFGLDVGCPDHLGPLLGFLGDQLAELVGRHRRRQAAIGDETRLHPGLGE